MDLAAAETLIQDYLKKHPNSKTQMAFLAAITLAYRNLFEQTDTGTILSIEDFVELLTDGSRAVQLEAKSAFLMKLVPNPSRVNAHQLAQDVIAEGLTNMIAEDAALHKFTDLLKKLLTPKGTPL
jgi:sulfur transfer complex TusBCD TusB component (DsrH family)